MYVTFLLIFCLLKNVCIHSMYVTDLSVDPVLCLDHADCNQL